MRLFYITAPYLIAAVIVLVAAYWGLSHALGAHLFWSTQIAWIGIPLGLTAALHFRRFAWLKRVFGFGVLLAAAGAAAHYGRLQFAASFAEDAVAGRLWFFGWISVAIFLSTLIASFLTPRSRTA